MFRTVKEKYSGYIYKVYAFIFALLIFIVSSLPGNKIPDFGIDISDKIIHFFEFGLFGIFLYQAFRFSGSRARPFLITLFIGIPYAALDEIHQFFVPGRYCGIGDFIADILGVVFFAGIFAKLNRNKSYLK